MLEDTLDVTLCPKNLQKTFGVKFTGRYTYFLACSIFALYLSLSWVWAEFRKCIAVQWDVLPKPDFIKDDVIDMNFGNDTEVYLQKIYFDPCIQLEDGKVREVMFMHWKKYKPQFTENFTFTGLKKNEWWAINTLGAQIITAN